MTTVLIIWASMLVLLLMACFAGTAYDAFNAWTERRLGPEEMRRIRRQAWEDVQEEERVKEAARRARGP